MFGISPSIRWRLATISAALTFVILCAFAIAIGTYTTSRIRSDFDNEIAAAVDRFTDRLSIRSYNGGTGSYEVNTPDLADYGREPDVTIRVLNPYTGAQVGGTKNAPRFPTTLQRSTQIGGYRIETRTRGLAVPPDGRLFLTVVIQYARRSSDVDATVARVRLFLILGVLAGTGLALASGLLLASRAMKPIAELTETASQITRTGDPNRAIPLPDTQDEVAELATTLDEMLKALTRSRSETEATLARQRQFVADASHELRTPLTSVLANLELLAAELEGERGEAAKSALRSSRRMRRLVADLLLLARADAQRDLPHHPTDLGKVVIDAAAELGAVADGHELTVDAPSAMVDGSPDDLHRLALNLMENAIHHTPKGTMVKASVKAGKSEVVLRIEDNGPGIPKEVRDHLFERFTRAGSDHAGSFGLGLSIVDAVTKSHGGTVKLERPKAGGTRFVVRLPIAST